MTLLFGLVCGDARLTQAMEIIACGSYRSQSYTWCDPATELKSWCFPLPSHLHLSISDELAQAKQIPCGTALLLDPLCLTKGDKHSNLVSSSTSLLLS